MNITKRILTIWAAYLLLSVLSFALPHHYFDGMAWVITSLQTLLLLISLYMVKDSTRNSKPIFVNFSLLFFLSLLSFNNIFVGTIFLTDSPYSLIIYHTYVGKIGFAFVLACCLLYLAFDYFFNNLKIYQKYLLTLTVSAVIFLSLFSPYVSNPLSLYNADEYSKYLKIKSTNDLILNETGTEPTNSELQQALLNGGVTQQITENDIAHLSTYLTNGSETILFWKPLDTNIIYVNIFLVLILALFVVHKYWNDKPHPAYLEKIAILFILWCSLDAFHYFAFAGAQSLELYRTLFTISQYMSIFAVLLMVYVFSVRLRFVLSASGKYYEEELLVRPETITRWRDEIDTLVVNSFFSSKKLIGRLFTF